MLLFLNVTTRLTSPPQTFDVGKNTSGQTAYPAGLGSGILVGVVGRSGADIDMFGPVFLNGVVTSISVSDVVYNPPLTGSGGISQQTLDSVHYYNPPDAKRDLPWVFDNQVKRTESTTFTQSTTTTYGISVNTEVSAELFGVGGKIGLGYSWQNTGTQTTSTSTSFEKSLHWKIGGSLQPGEGLTAVSFCQQGKGHANYTATVTLRLSDGTVSTYQEPGQFSTVVYTEAEVTTKPDN